tara:strand:+ start:1617 stop:2315 length:699 start_codon:yes stop_codon:yes gene_type:complete
MSQSKFKSTPGQLFSNTSTGCAGKIGGSRKKRRRRKRKRTRRRKRQRGGAKLIGPSHSSLDSAASNGMGRAVIPHHETTNTCNQNGGGLDFSDFKGSGHRPILNSPGYGYSQEGTGDNAVLAGSRPQVTSYDSNSCGGAKKRRRRKKKTKKRKNKRKNKKSRKRRKLKKKIKRRLIGCGQKGGSKLHSDFNPIRSFPGPVNMNLGEPIVGMGNALKVMPNPNCFDTYNHFSK